MKIKDIIPIIKPLSFSETLEYFEDNASKKGQKSFVVTINPEIIMLAQEDEEYEKVLKSADLAVCDGVGVVWAGKIFGRKFKGRVHGSDLVEGIVKAIEKKPITVGFIGGQGNVALRTANCLKEKYPELKVAFTLEEWPQDKDLKCDILFVAFGSPKQEKWIYKNLSDIDVKVAVGVGGAFDFISGKVPRAPKLIRSVGLEWLFRLLIQPWRIKRQLALPKFVLLVIKEKVFG
jgi:N-acetylglucosaminyldiphosphoundecaprenol N-acetyl-beta-D-mannosaminyltransferase